MRASSLLFSDVLGFPFNSYCQPETQKIIVYVSRPRPPLHNVNATYSRNSEHTSHRTGICSLTGLAQRARGGQPLVALSNLLSRTTGLLPGLIVYSRK